MITEISRRVDQSKRGFHIRRQSHYTSIVRLSTITLTKYPSLLGPFSEKPQHEVRMCQHLQLTLKGSAAKPIDQHNVNMPGNSRFPLDHWIRHEIQSCFVEFMCPGLRYRPGSGKN